MSERALKTFATHIRVLGLGKFVIRPIRRIIMTPDRNNEFFLFPTFTREQKMNKFKEECHGDYRQAQREYEENKRRGVVVIKFYAQVTDSYIIIPSKKITEPIRGLSSFYSLTPEDIEEIFVKGADQFSLPIVRIYKLHEPIEIHILQGMQFVNLPQKYSTAGETVLEKGEFENKRREVIKYIEDHIL